MALLTKDFLRRARAKHKNKYRYDAVEYRGMHKKVQIECPIHGMFEQTPASHLHQGSGCPTCGRARSYVRDTAQSHYGKPSPSLIAWVIRRYSDDEALPIKEVMRQIIEELKHRED